MTRVLVDELVVRTVVPSVLLTSPRDCEARPLVATPLEAAARVEDADLTEPLPLPVETRFAVTALPPPELVRRPYWRLLET